jgi:hypothetical protein
VRAASTSIQGRRVQIHHHHQKKSDDAQIVTTFRRRIAQTCALIPPRRLSFFLRFLTFPEFASTYVGNRVSKREKRGEKFFSWKLIAAFPRQEEETAKNSSTTTTTTTKEENCWRTEVKTRADAASGSRWSRIGVKSKEQEQEQEQPSFAKNTNEEKKRKQ